MTDAGPMQLFDALPGHITDALRASIERFGVLVPVVTDQHGTVLDGHHRKAIADQLRVKYRVDVITVAGDDEAREIARTLNSDRRQLTEDQRRDVAAALRGQGHSLRAIAGALGVGKSTVERDLATVPSGTVPERVTGLDGKSRPARRPVIVTARHEREAARLREMLPLIGKAEETAAATPGKPGDDARKITAAMRRGVLDPRDVRNLRTAATRIEHVRKADSGELPAAPGRLEKHVIDVTLAERLTRLATELRSAGPSVLRCSGWPHEVSVCPALDAARWDGDYLNKLISELSPHTGTGSRVRQEFDRVAADYERDIAAALAACEAAAARASAALEEIARRVDRDAAEAPHVVVDQHQCFRYRARPAGWRTGPDRPCPAHYGEAISQAERLARWQAAMAAPGERDGQDHGNGHGQ